MNATRSSPRPIVLCALEYERSVLLRERVGPIADVVCCGPGAANVRDWAQRIGQTTRSVILGGVAGALLPSLAVGTAHLISEVINESGTRWKPTLGMRSDRHARCVIVSTPGIVSTPAGKADLARRTGADLVDLESVAFATAAQQLGWKWRIVRGVSDGVSDALPPDIGPWINARGRTKPATVAMALLRRPTMLGSLLKMRRHTRAGLVAAAELIRTIIQDETGAH